MWGSRTNRKEKYSTPTAGVPHTKVDTSQTNLLIPYNIQQALLLSHAKTCGLECRHWLRFEDFPPDLVQRVPDHHEVDVLVSLLYHD